MEDTLNILKKDNENLNKNDNSVKELISVSKEEKEINTNNNSEGLIEKSILEKIKK